MEQQDWISETPETVLKVPLAERMRPKTLEECFGQEHLLAQGSIFRQWLTHGGSGNILLYGPPGCGKTTLAILIAQELKKKLFNLNAVLSNLTELKQALNTVASQGGQTILFIDEIHRFNRSQQDALLPYCEKGTVQLIGATTRLPSFYLIPPLLSRSHLFELKPLDSNTIYRVLEKTLKDEKFGLGSMRCEIDNEALQWLSNLAQGDLRHALNTLEYLVLGFPIGHKISLEGVKEQLKKSYANYNARESDHYDCISAYIKSIRGCDPDAAVYWLARMLNGGEDPLYIARRLVIAASEDIGLADSRTLNVAIDAYRACEIIGMPECALNLSHATIFLALSPKSNSTYLALENANALLKQGLIEEVPPYLRAHPPTGTKEQYLYSHHFPQNVSRQKYWSETKTLYQPKPIGAEEKLMQLWKERKHLRD